MTARLLRFFVEVYEPEVDDWDRVGSVLLPDLATTGEVEHALAPLGLYAPRGADVLLWDWPTDFAFGMIQDALGAPMIRLTAAHGG